MAIRSAGRKPSFDLLAWDSSGDERILSPLSDRGLEEDGTAQPIQKRRRNRGSKKRRAKRREVELSEMRSVVETICETSTVVEEQEPEVVGRAIVGCVSAHELRQRNVNGVSGGDDGGWKRDPREEEGKFKEESTGQWKPLEGNGCVGRLEKEGSLDWGRVLASHQNDQEETSVSQRSPFAYFVEQVYGGNALRSTISVGNERKRQRVYNTMFHVPLRCERLIIAGFFVCLDSFLSMLTIMPARILVTLQRAFTVRQFHRPDAAELSDFGCFIVLLCGVVTLQLTDISLIYHIIRGQGTIKLYVVYNVLEILDKLLQSFGEDVLQVLFSSAEGLATCQPDSLAFELRRFIFDEVIAVIVFILHSFILLAQAITLSTCTVAHNNALLALLISNNFAEIKGSVFKKVSKDNLQSLVYSDIIERFHITAFVLFVLAQNILEAEESWLVNFIYNALMVYLCEVLIDTLKHSFLAKFNEMKPDAYSEFLEDLCKQTLNNPSEEARKNLTFIPIAPACVVIRVLTPLYATLLPYGPLLWRWFWIVIWSALTFIILAICKVLVSLSLNRLATWYLKQRQKKQHID